MLPKSKEIYSSKVIKGYSGFILLNPKDKSSLADGTQGPWCTRTVGANCVESIENMPQCRATHQK